MKDLKDQYALVVGEKHPLLRSECEDVSFPLSQELKKLCSDIPLVMDAYDGVGLAAPQVGYPVKIAITTQWKQKGEDYTYLGETLMINPTIVSQSKETIITEEGCLSLPGITGMVQRPATIVVEYFDISGKKHTDTYSGFNAVVVQHEIDHLHGILFVDKLHK